MIRYKLNCADGHSFDSWFASSDEFDRLASRGLLTCAVCGERRVSKALMAPPVATRPAGPAGDRQDGPLSAPASPAEQALRMLRARIEAEAENVGRRFAAEARRIHAGEAPERQIYGEARLDETRALLEDGIPVAPLPWPVGRSN